MTAVESERILKIVEPVARRFVSAVDQPAIGLKEHGRTEKTFSIPPMTRASRCAAKAEDALLVSIDFVPILGRLKPLFFGVRRRRLKPGFYEGILCEKMRDVRNQVLDYSEMV